MLALWNQHLTPIQWSVFRSYCLAFATRGLYIKLESDPPRGPYLFTDGTPIHDKQPHCFWTWDDRDDIHPESGGCAWIWHHGPQRRLLAADSRVILLPRNDLFEIRGNQNTSTAWMEYRSRIRIPWHEKRDEIYFLGHFTGTQSEQNSRLRACRILRDAGLPANVALLPELVPPGLISLTPIKKPEPLHIMGQYKFVLSLWGNHVFNPRLYRGLEAGSLVFHQATPTVQFLEDGLLVPGRHYVEIAPDLSDLLEKFDYFRTHPHEARAIADQGHRDWMEKLYVSTPYTLADVIWERFISQPHWPAFRKAYDIH